MLTRMAFSHKPTSVLQSLHNNQLGIGGAQQIRTNLAAITLRRIKDMQLFTHDRLTMSRVTCLTWHSNHEDLLFVASKYGKIMSWNVSVENNKGWNMIQDSLGPGGCITCLVNSPFNSAEIITTSVDGKASIRNIETGTCNDYISQDDPNYSEWCVSAAICPVSGLLVIGDNKGNVTLFNTDRGKSLEKLGRLSFHRKKVSQLEFCPWDRNLLVSSSVDASVRLWDIRSLHTSLSSTVTGSLRPVTAIPFATLDHDTGLNNAQFSRVLGSRRLLTTDQNEQVRFYSPSSGGQWVCDCVIKHPHRRFQHMTPIMAEWHPNCDLAVAGRYPNTKDIQNVMPEDKIPTIDILDPQAGAIVHKITNKGISLISPLNTFSVSGRYLASAHASVVAIRKLDLSADDQLGAVSITNNSTPQTCNKRSSISMKTGDTYDKKKKRGKEL